MKKKWVPVLCYHRVCPPEEIGADSRSLCVSPSQFRSQMRLLKWLRIHPISAQDLTAYLSDRKNLPKKSIVLTFDDGYKDNYRHAFPVLKEFGFTACISLVTDSIGKTNAWDSGTQELMSEAEIHEMAEAGIGFGAHTLTHADLSKVSSQVLKEELEGSKRALERLTHRMDIPFCYPYTRINSTVVRATKEAGYICAFSGDHGPTDQSSDLFNLKRIQIFPSNNIFDFWRKIQPWYPLWLDRVQKKKK